MRHYAHLNYEMMNACYMILEGKSSCKFYLNWGGRQDSIVCVLNARLPCCWAAICWNGRNSSQYLFLHSFEYEAWPRSNICIISHVQCVPIIAQTEFYKLPWKSRKSCNLAYQPCQPWPVGHHLLQASGYQDSQSDPCSKCWQFVMEGIVCRTFYQSCSIPSVVDVEVPIHCHMTPVHTCSGVHDRNSLIS